ncbi:phospholipid carrier-dependent glycosyltransferase [Phormidium tenue FACHB-886]|nr:phospholipid carrier-dependent glycosyltransferase [Phormidium tenue FACHB-886]
MPAIAPKALSSGKSSRFSLWFWLGLTGIFFASLALRFWGLSRFNTLVFDEVYYAKFASAFLRNEIVFTGHPPLSTYIIAFGIWLGEKLPFGDHSLKNGLTGLLISPFSYRWLNAVTGSFLPLLVAAIAYQLSQRRTYALIAGLLLAMDGLFLVESRYALNNVYLLLFGLLGHLFFLLALKTQGIRRWSWLVLAGVGFGCSAAIKWNGLGFLLGALMIWAAAWVLRWLRVDAAAAPQEAGATSSTPNIGKRSLLQLPLQNLTQIHLGHILLCFAAIPVLVYYASWLPYLHLDATADNFWTLQVKTFDYHKRVGGLSAHPYCSLWFSWPLMLRPIAYFYKTSNSTNELPVVVGPQPQAANVIYDVHAMGNPILWWCSTAALILVVGLLLHQLWRMVVDERIDGESAVLPSFNGTSWIALYIGLNWVANLLPWFSISRCAFLYHYMESFVFSLLALALLVDRWLRSSLQPRRQLGMAVLVLVLAGFVFWMPIYLGLPLSPLEIQLRRWLPSWI